MSNDDTKDLTFNQKYAGRSRVRRDLNTIKKSLAAVNTPVSQGGTGVTNYELKPGVVGGLHATFITIGNSEGDGTGTLNGGAQGSSNGAHTAFTWSQLTNVEAQICVFRGLRDLTYSGVTEYDKTNFNIHHVQCQLLTQFAGPTTPQVTMGVMGDLYSGLSPENSTYGLLGLLASGGASLAGGTDTSNIVGDARYTVYPNGIGMGGLYLSDGVKPGWQDVAPNQGSATTGGVGSAGLVHLGGTHSALNTNSDYYPGVWVRLLSSSGNLSTVTAGKLGITIWFSIIKS
jgi:hypothetical protein